MARSRLIRVGFTLVELLVVITIIAVLVSMLLPVITRAKAAARSVQCNNNLRQLAVGMSLYVMEARAYQGFYTYFSLPEQGKGTFEAAATIVRWLPYLQGNHRLFYCPAQRPLTVPATYPGLIRLSMDDPLSYGWNVMGTGGNSPPRKDLGLGPRWKDDVCIAISENQVAAPANMIAMSDNSSGTHNDFIIAPNNDWVEWKPGTRHEAGVNLAYCDGHVGYGKTKVIIAPNDQARQHWNNDNQPHRETW